MKAYLQQLVNNAPELGLKKSVAREYLQARTLQMLQESGAFINWAFLGGTALRFLYAIPRYSEDLDFSTVGPDRPADFRKHLLKIKDSFLKESYRTDIKMNDGKAVAAAFIKFEGLPYELGLSPHPTEVLSIKLEVDTRPPRGAATETTLVRRYVPLNLQHYDKPSLLAGKIHALLSRPYVKGRDLYDLFWYLADRSWPTPNFTLLNAALAQTNWPGQPLQAENWQGLLAEKLESINWDQAVADVQPFLEREADLQLLQKEACLKLLISPGL
jgi:predicted nucleotidyltransferase component of viral defense system